MGSQMLAFLIDGRGLSWTRTYLANFAKAMVSNSRSQAMHLRERSQDAVRRTCTEPHRASY